MVPIVMGWEYLPHRKGAVSGLVLFGFGCGSFIFGFVAQPLANPHNLSPQPVGDEKMYGPEVAERVPFMLRMLTICWAVLAYTAILMIRRKKAPEDFRDRIRSESIQE